MAIHGVIRRLWAGERDLVRDHLLRLESKDRQLRFGGYASNTQIAAYCDGLEWRRGLVLGYVVAGQVCGVGELKPIGADTARAAELAVSVERSFQNRGIGTALLRQLVTAARNRLIASWAGCASWRAASGAQRLQSKTETAVARLANC